MEVTILSGFWLIATLAVIVAYCVDQSPSSPNVWRSMFRYGKTRVGVVSGEKQFFEVPKRWFFHFYVVGVVCNSMLLVILVFSSIFGYHWPKFCTTLIHFLQFPASASTDFDNLAPVLLVIGLECVQVWRRSYECCCVHNFSQSGTMTLFHYLLGFIFYLSIGFCVLAGTDFQHLTFQLSMSDCVMYLFSTLLFFWATRLQHRSFRTLAALRSEERHEAKRVGVYVYPEGGLFDSVSCPHYLAEMFIYLSFCIAFSFKHSMLMALFTFVLVNQTIAGLITYQWYCQHFPGYGKHHKAVFPYIL